MGQDASAPAYVRRRALAAAGRAGAGSDVAGALAGLAADASAPRLVRIGALEGLGRAAPTEAATLRAALEHDVDSVLAELARRR